MVRDRLREYGDFPGDDAFALSGEKQVRNTKDFRIASSCLVVAMWMPARTAVSVMGTTHLLLVALPSLSLLLLMALIANGRNDEYRVAVAIMDILNSSWQITWSMPNRNSCERTRRK